MQKRLAWLTATASGVALATPVHAQPPLFNWTGFYVGGHVGGSASSNKTYNRNGFASGNLRSFDSDETVASYGGQIGYNWQLTDRFVVGLEADASEIGAKKHSTSVGGLPGVASDNEVSWLATFRARAGLPVNTAAGSMLIYVSGGFAVGGVKNQWGMPASPPMFNNDETKIGGVLGGGIEFATASNWTFRIEGFHVDLGNSSSTINNGGTYKSDFKNAANTGRVALSFRW